MTGDHNSAFTTPSQANNWLQIDFGTALCVRDIVVLKREQGEILLTNDNIPRRWEDVEARIGNTATAVSTGLNALTSNTICNTDNGNNEDLVAFICCTTPLTGRYLTLQSTASTYLEADEVYVYTC